MYAILNPNIALRSWPQMPYSFIVRNQFVPVTVNKEFFEVMLMANGHTDIPDSEAARKILAANLMLECGKGEYELTSWQQYHRCDNRFVPNMCLQITGHCNFNCLHCFNAKDNHALQSHMTLEQIRGLLDQAQSCGICGFTLTGGEPMVHKNIKEIIYALYERNMFLSHFNTNGYFLTQEFLDFLKSLGASPEMKISFDGVGFHDTMRNFSGAEEQALKAMELCVKNGFRVMAQVNVNYDNLDSMSKTMDLLDSMGINIIRLIRTTEVPRWLKNGGKCLDMKDYYDSMIEILSDYISKPRTSTVYVWQTLKLDPRKKAYVLDMVNNIRPDQPLCIGSNMMISVGANGNVYPCLQASGIMDDTGVRLGNVFETPLKDILQSESEYTKCVCMTVEQKAKINGKCINCKYFKYCGTGCPAMSVAKAYAEQGTFNYTNPDPWKCYFFEHGYYEKVRKALSGYRCMPPEIEP